MGFGNPVVGGNTLIRDAIQSPDYADGSAGWAIRKDGTAQFSDIDIIDSGSGDSEITVGQVNTAILGLFPGNTGTQVDGGLVAQHPVAPFGGEVWNDLTLTSGWAAVIGENTPGYRLIPLDIGGIVAFRGVIQVPASGAYDGVTFATIGTGYLPAGVSVRWPVINITGSLGVTGYCTLDDAGGLQFTGLPAGFSSGHVDLTGLAWIN
jgi:hypothetical protein